MKKSVKALIAVCVCLLAVFAFARIITKKELSETKVEESSEISGTKTALKETEAASLPEKTKEAAPSHAAGGFGFSSLFAYSGVFVEDGSDEPTENTAAVTVKNTSDRHCRYTSVEIRTENGSYEFEFSTLMRGESMTVLEKSGKPLSGTGKIKEILIKNTAGFEEEPSLYEDIFELTIYDRVINIKNISETDIDGTVFVYYKNKDENGLFGGITYRVRFDSLKAGEIKQASSAHLSAENSVTEFITYEH